MLPRFWSVKTSIAKAFTLAELLVVVGILGLIAGITVPRLLHNIQMVTFKTSAKSTISMVAESIKKVDEVYGLTSETRAGPGWSSNAQGNFSILELPKAR
jgi:prepilin-type N-terminal cleavage/methylation domain-containing protein